MHFSTLIGITLIESSNFRIYLHEVKKMQRRVESRFSGTKKQVLKDF